MAYGLISLSLAALFFIGIHLGLSGTRLRDGMVARIGLTAYMVVFSAAYVPSWGQLQWWKPVMIALMLPAFLLVVIGLTTPNPTAVGQEKLVGVAPRGIVRVTRHPFLVGVALWSALHLVGNGDLASGLFFVALAIVSLAGAASIDAKRRRAVGAAAWDAFAAQTSIVPFAAIAAGRNRFVARELGWWRPAAGVAAYALMLGGHAHLIGVSPFPQ